MKKISIITLIMLIAINLTLFSQTDSIQKYRRSSLTMILLQGTIYEDEQQKQDKDEVKIDCSPQAISKLWNEYPFPDLYDKLDIPNGNIEVRSYLSSQDIFAARKNKKQIEDAEKTRPKIERALKEKKVAQQMVKRWFSSEDGSKFWDMGTVHQRGFYNATESEAAAAKHFARGMAKLADAGEELLNNSFVTVTDLLIYANKPISDLYFALADEFLKQAQKTLDDARGKDATARLSASITALAFQSTAAGLAIAGGAIKDGYTVVSKTYLFKLKWNKQIENELYNIWGDDIAFEKMNFELEYIGYQLNETVVNRGMFHKRANRKPELVIQQTVVRNIDEAFVKLQHSNEVFKPSVPVLGIHPISAQIGMKEGLHGGEKFNVLQTIQDPKTGKISYKKVGQVRVDNQYVWDNRYNAGEQPERINLDANGNPINVTYFKGSKNVHPGMLLKQVKAKKKKKNKH